MICQRCGCLLDKDAKVCSFCGEPLAPGVEDVFTRAVGDAGAARVLAGMEPLVELAELAPVPADRDLLAEVRRLADYFSHHADSYGVLDDLWLKRLAYQEPSLLHWTIGGGLATVLIYALVGSFLPQILWAFFFVLWGAITCIGYIRSGRQYELDRARMEVAIRHTANEVRRNYNAAERNFLPLDYTSPQALRELIHGLETGTLTTFDGYHPS